MRATWSIAAIIFTFAQYSVATTYFYPATCHDSRSKQGEQSDDLTKQTGRTVNCDSVVLSLLDNGNVQVQFAQKTGNLSPLGFAGAGIDYEINPALATIPLARIYLPHSNNPNTPQVVDGIEGYCFLEGKINIRSLSSISCAAKMEIGPQKLIYKINAQITGPGQKVPGF